VSTPEERIAELARKNALSPADAAKLLAAVKVTPAGSAPNLFDRIGTPTLIAIGCVTSALSLGLAHFGVRFPGFLDIFASTDAAWSRAIVDQLVAFPLGALVFWIAGRIVGRPRYVDMLATVGAARLPAVVSIVPAALSGNHALGILTLVGIALQITFLVIGFRTASGARGKSLVFGVIGAICVAETLAKVIVYFAH
jgi:hypothetical protein